MSTSAVQQNGGASAEYGILDRIIAETRLSPDDDQFRFVLAIALHDTGDSDGACHELEQLLQRHPANRTARLALIDYLRETGQFQKVQQFTAELEQQNPDDPALKRE